jgi:hypothetical protein
MKDPVSNIKISFYAFPDKNTEIYDKPKVTLRLKQFVDIRNKKPSEKQRTDY